MGKSINMESVTAKNICIGMQSINGLVESEMEAFYSDYKKLEMGDFKNGKLLQKDLLKNISEEIISRVSINRIQAQKFTYKFDDEIEKANIDIQMSSLFVTTINGKELYTHGVLLPELDSLYKWEIDSTNKNSVVLKMVDKYKHLKDFFRNRNK